MKKTVQEDPRPVLPGRLIQFVRLYQSVLRRVYAAEVMVEPDLEERMLARLRGWLEARSVGATDHPGGDLWPLTCAGLGIAPRPTKNARDWVRGDDVPAPKPKGRKKKGVGGAEDVPVLRPA